MSKDVEIDPYYQKQGCELVDMLHDNKIINPDITRDDLRELENYIAYQFQSNANMAAKTSVMLERLSKKQ